MTDGCLPTEILTRFLEGRADAKMRAQLEEHASRCERCREVLSALGRYRTPPAVRPRSQPYGDRLLAPGTQVGRYVIVREIGAGGMGVVYAARDPELERMVAVKVLRGDSDPRTEARLRREAQAMAQLAHPNVVAVYDVGAFDERMFIAMEYVAGETLARWIGAPRSRREILDAYCAAGRGLAAAHAAGLVHRDFKPENVLIGDDGRVRVGDFGLALCIDGGDAPGGVAVGWDTNAATSPARLTASGTLLGTPCYIAPELYDGGEADARSDQFSFCVALFVTLYGELPFNGDTLGSFAANVRSSSLHDPRGTPRVSRRIRRAIKRGLATDPASRFASLDELLDELAWPSQRRALWAIGPGAALAVVAWLVTRPYGASPEQRCTGATAALTTASNTQRPEAIENASTATRTSSAAAAARRVPGALAPYTVQTDVPPGQLTFRVYAGTDGLRNLVISSITQDGNGLLWLGTDDGVYRFDGVSFKHFSANDGLLASYVLVVGVAPDGNVCVGEAAGLVCWNGRRFSQASTRGLPAVPIHTIVSYAGKLWVGTEGAGLYVQSDAGAFVPAPGWPGSAATTIRALWADASGLVVGDGATAVLTSGDGTWQKLGEVGLGTDSVVGILRDREGALWMRTQTRMWRLARGTTRAIDLSAGLPTGYEAIGGPTGMAIGPRGDVLIATDVGLAYRESGHWRLIDRSTGLPTSVTRALFVDREQTLWIGAAGLLQLRGRGVIEHHDMASGLPGDVVWSYRRDRKGTLWVGTNHCLARAVFGRWECLPGSEGRVVRSFVFPPQGGVFLGGAPADLLYIAPDGRTTSLGHFERVAGHNILALALAQDGDLWVATNVGLFRLRGAVPGPLERIVIPDVRADARFESLAVVGDQLWTAPSPGAGVAVLDHGAWRRFDKTAGLRDTAIGYVIARADGRMCVAYYDDRELACFRYDGHAISALQHLGPPDGLDLSTVYFLGEDRQQRLWVGTGNGVDVVTPDGIDHFDQRDGLAGDDSAAMAFLLDSDGSVWLGANGGATHVFAQHYGGPPPAPRTAFLDGQLGDRSILDAPTTLEVPHDRGALDLEFAAASLLDDKRVGFQVRLPLETTWSATHQREVRCAALLPGAYRLDVRARIGAGSWGPAAELSFIVLPAWWQTRWFVVATGVAGLLVIAGAVTWRQRMARRRRRHARGLVAHHGHGRPPRRAISSATYAR